MPRWLIAATRDLTVRTGLTARHGAGRSRRQNLCRASLPSRTDSDQEDEAEKEVSYPGHRLAYPNDYSIRLNRGNL